MKKTKDDSDLTCFISITTLNFDFESLKRSRCNLAVNYIIAYVLKKRRKEKLQFREKKIIMLELSTVSSVLVRKSTKQWRSFDGLINETNKRLPFFPFLSNILNAALHQFPFASFCMLLKNSNKSSVLWSIKKTTKNCAILNRFPSIHF